MFEFSFLFFMFLFIFWSSSWRPSPLSIINSLGDVCESYPCNIRESNFVRLILPLSVTQTDLHLKKISSGFQMSRQTFLSAATRQLKHPWKPAAPNIIITFRPTRALAGWFTLAGLLLSERSLYQTSFSHWIVCARTFKTCVDPFNSPRCLQTTLSQTLQNDQSCNILRMFWINSNTRSPISTAYYSLLSCRRTHQLFLLNHIPCTLCLVNRIYLCRPYWKIVLWSSEHWNQYLLRQHHLEWSQKNQKQNQK